MRLPEELCLDSAAALTPHLLPLSPWTRWAGKTSSESACPDRTLHKAASTTRRRSQTTLAFVSRLVSISDIFDTYLQSLKPVFANRAPDVTEENVQARIRGSLLMAMSNKLGALVLTTGNKSEIGVGYCTLYGDMCGGLAVISDVPKTLVYRLARYVNSRTPCDSRDPRWRSLPQLNCVPTRKTATRYRPTMFSTEFWKPMWKTTNHRNQSRRSMASTWRW